MVVVGEGGGVGDRGSGLGEGAAVVVVVIVFVWGGARVAAQDIWQKNFWYYVLYCVFRYHIAQLLVFCLVHSYIFCLRVLG